MFPYTRLHELFNYLTVNKCYCSSDTLAKQLKISQRTLRNDIHVLNESLSPYHAKIKMKRGQGYYLVTEKEEDYIYLKSLTFEKEDTLDSADKRINHILIKLLYSNNYLTQDDLADEVFVSINTIINYLKTIRIILENYQLKLHTKANLGYKIIGSEIKKRQCIIDLLTSTYHEYEIMFSKEQMSLLNNINLNHIKNIVMDFNRRNNVHFSDYNLKNLILHIALAISRLQVEKPVEEAIIPDDESIENLLNPLINEIENEFNIVFNKNERNYIYTHYVSNTNELLKSQNNIDYIRNLVDNIIESIYELYHFDFRSDMILKKDLTHHLQSILNTKYYKLNKKNPLLNTIKNNYILSYEITETAVKQSIIDEPFDLTDGEIAYISLHIGAAIERYFDTRYLQYKKVIIVYNGGYATGSFLESKLKTLFKDSLEIIGKYPSHEISDLDLSYVDLIISTVSLSNINKPVIVVNIPFLRKDMENIANAITYEANHPIDKIMRFFDEDLFLNTDANSKNEIIHQLCTLLKNKNYINGDFEQSVLEREQKISTAMDGVIALPHPLKICSTESKIAVGILKNPITWSEKDNAQIVLLLSLADDSKKDIEKLYDTFVLMTHNPALQNLLFQAKTLQEFLSILKTNIDIDSY